MTPNFKTVTALVSLTSSLPFAEGEARDAISAAIGRRIEEGTTHFICPMRQGFELLMAEETLALRRRYPITLEALLPHELIAADWEEEVRDRFFSAVERVDLETLFSTHPFPAVEERCQRLLVRLSNSVIAVADGPLPPWLRGEDVTLLSPDDLGRKMA